MNYIAFCCGIQFFMGHLALTESIQKDRIEKLN